MSRPEPAAIPWLQAAAKPTLRRIGDQAHVRMPILEVEDVLARPVSRGVVDDDQFVPARRRMGKDRFKTELADREVVERHDHDGGRIRPSRRRGTRVAGQPGSRFDRFR